MIAARTWCELQSAAGSSFSGEERAIDPGTASARLHGIRTLLEGTRQATARNKLKI